MLLTSPLFSDKVVHGFSTVPQDFSPQSTDWAQFSSFFGKEYQYALVSQVHGDQVVTAHSSGLIGEADALTTSTKGLVLAIRTADCVPVLVEAENEVFAIHAGWRGIANGIITKVLCNVVGLKTAVVGPCISVDAYEVGQEVVDGIMRSGIPREIFVQEREPRPHVDLKAAASYQLMQVGVPNIDVLPHCTFFDERFHSYRRDGNRSGRIAGFIGFAL